MDEKLFDLMTKMYSEFSEFRKDITKKVEQNTDEIKKLGNQVTSIEN